MATTPFSFEGTLTLPSGPNLPGEPIPFLASSTFSSQVEYVLDLPSTGSTIAPGFGTMPTDGAKAIALQYDNKTGAAPVNLTVNGGTDKLEVSTGGFLFYHSPTPSDGITAISLTHTTSGTIRVWILG